MIYLILNNLVVVLSSYYISRQFSSRKTSFTDCLLIWFSVYFALIVFVEISLGIFKILTPLNITIFQALILLEIYIFQLPKSYYPIYKYPDLSFLYSNKAILFPFCVALAFFIVKITINLLNPPVGVDSLIYHLTYPVSWLKTSSLYNPMIIFGADVSQQATTNAIPYYPINGELFFFWLLFPLKSAFLADIGGAPFYLVAILAIYSILRKHEVNKQTSLFIAVLWVLIPNVLKHVETGSYVDIICASLFLLALNFLLLLDTNFNFKNAFLFGMGLGLFIGTKTINIFWSIALMPFFIYILVKQIKEKKVFSVSLNTLALLSAVVIFGSYSYIRSFILTKNLFYPVKFSLFGKTLMPGYIDRLSFANLTYHFNEFSIGKLFFHEGLGAQFIAFIVPATFIPLSSLFFINKFRNRLWHYFCMFVMPAFMFLSYLFYLKLFWTRYLYAYLGIGFIAAGIFLDSFKWGRKYIIVAGLISVLASMAEFSARIELLISIALSFLLFILLTAKYKLHIKLPAGFKKIILVFILGFAIGALFLLNKKHDNEFYDRYIKFYEEQDVALAWKWLDNNTGQGARIAYTGRAEYFPLFGRGLKNEVYYISVNDRPSSPHLYPDGLYRKDADYHTWRKNLITNNTQFLFIYQPHESREFPIEKEWADASPDAFLPLFGNSKAYIYQISR